AREPTIRRPVRVQACVHAGLDAEQGALGVQVVERQRRLFADLPGVTPLPRIERAADLVAFLAAKPPPTCDLLYAFCHATAAATRDALFSFTTDAPDDQATLVVERGQPVTVATMRTLRRAPLPDRPLVFLNACASAAGDEAFQAPLLEQFLDRWQAIGVIGTDWEVPTMFADAFAHQLLGYFLRDRLPLGEAFARATRDAVDAGNPFALVYALYAPPELVVR
ncbi:MAG TPA: CHAT domain-containing protein, partial [Kofleriaceae bacterium]|nr:CHAT domain-containing protein [Kofleriaceae bacterium]